MLSVAIWYPGKGRRARWVMSLIGMVVAFLTAAQAVGWGDRDHFFIAIAYVVAGVVVLWVSRNVLRGDSSGDAHA